MSHPLQRVSEGAGKVVGGVTLQVGGGVGGRGRCAMFSWGLEASGMVLNLPPASKTSHPPQPTLYLLPVRQWWVGLQR